MKILTLIEFILHHIMSISVQLRSCSHNSCLCVFSLSLQYNYSILEKGILWLYLFFLNSFRIWWPDVMQIIHFFSRFCRCIEGISTFTAHHLTAKLGLRNSWSLILTVSLLISMFILLLQWQHIFQISTYTVGLFQANHCCCRLKEKF